MADYTLSAKITGDSSDFESAIKKSKKAVSGFEKETKSLGTKLDGIGSGFQQIGAGLTAGVTFPLAAAGTEMVNAASDFEENLNKVDVAFGDSAETVKSWADTATESFGLSKNQALEAAALFGDMGTSMGLVESDAANMSTSLAGLAGDLASFKNIDIDQAITALSGVFTGETESLKSLGIVMTETNLKEFANQIGVAYDELSQAEKVQLRYNYVMSATQNAQGDYVRTADGTANSMRTFQSSIENLSVVLGQQLLPLITPLIQKATELVTKFTEMDPETQKMIVGFMLLAAAVGPVSMIFGTVLKGAGSFISFLPTLTTGLSSMSTLFGGVGGTAGAASAAISGTSGAAAGAGGALAGLAGPVGIVIAVLAALAAIFIYLFTTNEDFRNNMISSWNEIKATVGPLLEELKVALGDLWQNVLKPFLDFIAATLAPVFEVAFSMAGESLSSFVKLLTGIIQFITGVFTGDWEKAWTGIQNIFGGIWETLVMLVKLPLNAMIALINGVINGLNSLNINIPDWVPVVGGKSFNINIPQLPYLLHGTDDWQGGFARMNEGGRGEMVMLPSGSQVIPHDVSMKYAEEAARANTVSAYTGIGAEEGILDANNEQNRLLMVQNELLRAILDKDASISIDDVFSGIRAKAKEFKKRTGDIAFG